jgi:ligand-binding SRPBCC domain-containing protein
MKTKLIPALFIIVAVSIAAAFFFTKKFNSQEDNSPTRAKIVTPKSTKQEGTSEELLSSENATETFETFVPLLPNETLISTLTIDFNNNVSALTADVAEAVKITARLYDNNHNEVDFNNESLNLECEWSWAYYHQFSNEQEETFLTDALNAQGKKAEDLSYAELNRIRSEAVLAKVGESGVLIKTNQDEGFENNPDNVCFLEHPANIPMNKNGLFMIL